MTNGMNQQASMDADTRRKIFWLLQRLTSYSLWECKRDAWEKFARAYEDAVKTWPGNQAEQMPADNLPGIYNILSLYDEGLAELRKGNRSVWREGGALNAAIREYCAVSAYLYPHGDYWERGAQQAPYPPKVEALNRLMRASEFHGEAAPLESSAAEDESAQIDSPNWLLDPRCYQYGFHTLQYPVFPQTLPEVPDATNVIIRSGQGVPASGIWEPVHVRRDRILGLIPAGIAETKGIGCFNYFVSGTVAPKILGDYDEATDRFHLASCNWRLLWRDTRYEDGAIPDESEYFIETKAPPVFEPDERIREFGTSEICPVSGLWEPVGYKNPPIQIAAGAVMPELSVRDAKGDMVLHYVKWRLVKRV